MQPGRLIASLAVAALVATGGLWALLRGAEPKPDELLVEPGSKVGALPDAGSALPPAPVPRGAPDPDGERGSLAASEAGDAPSDGALADDALVPRDSLWLSGRVVLPAGTPYEPELAVVARGKAFGAGTRRHRAPVSSDGRFRVAFAEGTRTGRIELESRWLYLPKSIGVRLKDAPDEVVLEPELAGVLAGTLAAPRALVAAPLAFEGVQITAYLAVPNEEVSVHETTRPDAEGRFELPALPPGAHYTVQVNGDPYLDLRQTGVEVRRGERTELELELVLGVELAGRVVDERGVGVPGASLETRTQRDGAVQSSSYQGDGTDVEGRFRLRGLEAGSIALTATKAGYLEAEQSLGELRLGELREGLELVLREGLAVEGVVRWPDGSPARGARVQVEQASDREEWLGFNDDERETRTDEGGRFRLAGLMAGPCTVSASASSSDGEGAPDWLAQLSDVPAGTRQLIVVLGPGGVLTGRVVDDLGAPLDDFRVLVSEDVGSGFKLFAGARGERYRDAGGEFELSGLEPGAWELRVSATGHADSAPQRVSTPRLSNPGATAPLEFVLARLGEISGRVVDPGGAALHRAHVVVGQDEVRTRSKPDGDFRLRRVPPGPLVLQARHDEHGDSEPLALELSAGGSIEGVTLVVRVPARLTIALHSGAGPPAGRTVVVAHLDGSLHESLVTDGAGRIELEALTPGNYQLTLEPEEDPQLAEADAWLVQRARQRSCMVELAPGEHARVVLGEPPEDAIHVRGQVTEAGRAVPDVVVAFSSRLDSSAGGDAARTDAAGRFELTLSAPGTWHAAIGGGREPVVLDVEIPAVAEHELELQLPTGVMRGLVRDPEGRPAAGCPVVVVPEGADAASPDWSRMRQTETDEAGRFEFLRLSSGTYALTAGGELHWMVSRRRDAHAPQRLGGLVLGEGEVLDGLELDLGRPAELDGTVIGPDGAPVAGARLAIEWPAGGSITPWPSWSTDAAGRFHAEGLPAGRLRVSARHGALTSEPSEVLLRAGETSALELVLRER